MSLHAVVNYVQDHIKNFMYEEEEEFDDDQEQFGPFNKCEWQILLSEANSRIRNLQLQSTAAKEALKKCHDSIDNIVKEHKTSSRTSVDQSSVEIPTKKRRSTGFSKRASGSLHSTRKVRKTFDFKKELSKLEQLQKELKTSYTDLINQKSQLESEKSELETQLQQSKEEAASNQSNSIAGDSSGIESISAQNVGEQNSTGHSAEYWMQKALAFEAEKNDVKIKYEREYKERKKLYNKLQDIKGNIRVFARCRPLLKHELDKNAQQICTFPDAESISIMDSKNETQRFRFDRVFDQASENSFVYSETVQPYVRSVLDGYNVTIFAYGQTGSGKTFTMNSVNSNAINDIFEKKYCDTFQQEWDISIKVSMLEIYNETIIDLLNQNNSNIDYKIRNDVKNNIIFVEGLQCCPVENANDVFKLMEKGSKNRTIAQTQMNAESSRSHSLLILYINGKNKVNNIEFSSKLNLIDLAGSERVKKSKVEGNALLEAQNINKSLSALGDVIQALSKKNKKHIPYRNSKLTYLLQDSLGKSAKTLMFINVSPADYNCSETLCTLKFAQRAKKVELGQATKNTSN